VIHDLAFVDSSRHTIELMQGLKVVLLRIQKTPAETTQALALPCTKQAIQELTRFAGCQHIVAFFCVFEGLLSRVRDAELKAEVDLIALLLSCCELVIAMVSQISTHETDTLSKTFVGNLEKSLELIRLLRAHHGYQSYFMIRSPEASRTFVSSDRDRYGGSKTTALIASLTHPEFID
jgi:chemotaxis protein histidine kinase CheA